MAFTLVTPQMVIARNAAFYGVAVGNSDMATFVGLEGTNPDALLNSVYISSVGDGSTTDVAAQLVTNLGLTGLGTPGSLGQIASDYIVGQLNASPVATRGAVINQILKLFSTLDTNPDWGPAATAWNTKILSATDYASQAGNISTTWANLSGTSTSLNSFTLTTGVDNKTATNFFASETYFNVDGKGPTLNTGDNLTGTAAPAAGGLANNTLTITDLTPNASNGNIPAGVTLNNIQNVILHTSNNTSAGTGFSTVGYADVRNLTVSTNGDFADIVAAKNGTNGTVTTVTHNGFALGGTLNVIGGTNVIATSVGGNITVGTPLQAVRVPLATEVTTGTIVVNQDGTGAGTARVFGGTTVDVNTTSTSNTGAINVGNTAANTGNTVSGIIANASDRINVNTSGTGAVTVFGGTNVVVNDNAINGAGAITVGDVTYVAPSNQASGNVTITEKALFAYNALSGASNNNVFSGAIGVFGGKNVLITTNAANAVNVGNLGAVKADALNPTGTITITNTGIVDSAVARAGINAATAGTVAAAAAFATGTVAATAANAAAAVPGAVVADVAAAINAVAVDTGAILLTGGTNVTISTTGANVTIGRTANAVTDQVSNPTGNISVTETLNGNGAARTITIDGGVNDTVNAKGQNVLIGGGLVSGPTGTVLVNQSDILTGNGAYLANTNPGNVTVNGGTSVTVNTTGGHVTVGGVVGAVNAVPTGAVAITRTFSGPGADTTTVQGGTTVAITTTKSSGAITVGDTINRAVGFNYNATAAGALNSAGSGLKDANLAPAGNITIVNATTAGAATAYGTANTNVLSNGATTVSITGGNVNNVVDIQSILATGGSNAGKAVGTSTLQNVIITGLQGADNAAISSDALTALSLINVQGGANTVTITNNTAAHALTITQGGNSATGGIAGAINNATTVIDAKATTLTVTDNATASTGALAVQAVLATSLTVNNAAAATINVALDAELTTVTLKGAGAVTLQNVDTLGKIASIDASASTGAVTTSITASTAAGVSQKFIGGTGQDIVTVNSNAQSWGNGVLLTAGSATTDTIVANYAATGTDVAMGNTASVKGFEFLGLGAAATGTYDATGFSGVTEGAVTGAITITNMAKNASLSIKAAPGFATTLTPSASTTGTTDGLTINVNTNTDGINANTVTANGYEAISIVSNGAVGNQQPTVNTMTLADTGSAGTGTLAISGQGKLTLTDNGLTATRFSSITDTSTATVNVNAVTVSNIGAAITGGTASLLATGATGGTQVSTVVLDGTTTKTFAIGNTWTVNVSNTNTAVNFVYTAAATDTIATAAAYMAAAINAGATTGPVILTGANPAITATASGGNLTLVKTAPFQTTTALVIGGSTVTTSTAALVGATEEQLITFSGVSAAAALSSSFNINGNAVTYTAAAAGETAAQSATGLAAAINALAAANKIGLTSAVASGATVILTGGINGTFMTTTVAGAVVANGITTTVGAIGNNYATANDSFTTGSGGGTYTVGLGGSWGNTLHRYSSGNEAINLAASTAKVDTVIVADGRVVTNNGTSGGVTGYTVGNLLLSDKLTFATANKTAIANVSVASAVSAAAGAATMAAVLDPSGALLTALTNLTYTISNGVITFSATGGNNLSQFTTAQLISAAEILVNSTTTGAAHTVAVFSTGGNSYVVASDAATTLRTGVDAKDILVQLTGVASSTGFGTTGAQGTVVVGSLAGVSTLTTVASAVANTGSASVAVYDETGFSYDNITAAKFGTVSTSVTKLAPSAALLIGANGDANPTLLALSTTQTGTAGLNSLTLSIGTDTLSSVNITGDGLLVLTPTGINTITSLVDGGATNTLATIQVGAGAFATTIAAITDTALTSVDSSAATGAVTFGNTTAIANAGVTFKMAVGQNSTITATGAGDIFNQGTIGSLVGTDTGAGVVTLTASGSADVFSLNSTAAGNAITASGANDTFNVGGAGSFTITATGSGDTFNIASGAGATTVTVGASATVNIGTANVANGGAETVVVTAATAGGTSANFASTTINFASASTVAGHVISFGTTGDAFAMLGDPTPLTNATAAEVAGSQINVAGAASLAAALDMAANYTALTQVQGATAASANLAANSGVIDWFQYGGNTYIEAMVNSSNAAMQHTALMTGDIVVKITGLVDLSTASAFTQATEKFTI
ncbi:MAG: hypothetical protein WCH01_00285 [Methylococcaceae bacterium]